jgi:nickel-dependent lactate racemase
LPLPEGWRVEDLSDAEPEPGSFPAAELVRAALEAPLGAKPFSRRDLSDERLTIVVDARQRDGGLPLLFRQVVRHALEAGASPDRIRVLFARGTDGTLSHELMVQTLGWAGALPFQARCTNWQDETVLAFLGKTQGRTPVYLDRWLDDTDLVVVIGAVDVDPFYGYGGGLRAIVPGCAGRETLEAYPDLLAAQPDPWLAGVGSPDNPLAADADEAARMCPAEVLVVSVVLDAHGRPVQCAAGAATRVAEAIQGAVADHWRLDVRGLADVVVTSSTPFDGDLREGLRAVALSASLVPHGGVVLACLKCDQGRAPAVTLPRFVPNAVLRLFLETVGNARVLKYVRKTWRDLGPEDAMWAFLVLALLRHRRVVVYAPNLDADGARRLGPVEWFADLGAAIDRAARAHPGASAYLLARAGLRWYRREIDHRHA